MSIIIDQSKCIKCGKCVADCVAGALSMGSNGVEAGKYCINCQHCLSICPVGAISLDKLSSENCREVPQLSEANYQSLCDVMRKRYSIRKYKKESVNWQTITEILHQLRFIPTGCNFHDLQIRVIGGEKLDELRAAAAKKIVDMLNKGEISKPFSGILGSMKAGLEAGEDMLFRNAPHLIVVAVNKKAPCPEDGIIALTNFELLANAKGLGTCWCGVGYWIFKFIAPELAEVLELDENHTVVHTMLFGIPDVEYARSKDPEDFDFTII